jgi:4-aminobutyrate aminotransferase
LGALRVNGLSSLRDPIAKLIPNNSLCIPFPNTQTDTEIVISMLNEIINSENDTDNIGAVIIEPMQNPAGYRMLSSEFCSALSTICKNNNVLLISDEVFTGFGRTGYWCLSEQIGLESDIYCFGKCITGGIPAGACVASKDLFKNLSNKEGIPLHSSTFFNSPIICTAIATSIQILESEDIPTRSQQVGEVIINSLATELRNSQIIKNVHGKGCAIAIQFTDNIENLTGNQLAKRAVSKLYSKGILTINSGFPNGDILALMPVATITEKEINRIIESVITVHQEILNENIEKLNE